MGHNGQSDLECISPLVIDASNVDTQRAWRTPTRVLATKLISHYSGDMQRV